MLKSLLHRRDFCFSITAAGTAGAARSACPPHLFYKNSRPNEYSGGDNFLPIICCS